MSIRTRLALAVTLVLVLTVSIVGVVLIHSIRGTLVGQVDQQVLTNAISQDRDDVESAQAIAQGDSNGHDQAHPDATPPATDRTGDVIRQERSVAHFVYAADGTLLVNEPTGFPASPESPPDLPPIPSTGLMRLLDHIVTINAVDGSSSYRVLVQRATEGDVLVTAVGLGRVDAAVQRLTRVLLLFGAIFWAITTMLVWLLIRRELQPVDRMVDTAVAIAAGDLSQRVSDANPRTELGRLGSALNDMLHQIEEAIRIRTASEERLRRFIGDAAHELRTPLTSVRGYAELHRQGAIPDQTGVTKAMSRIEAEAGRMARLVDEMLLLARLDQQRGLEQRPFDLGALVNEAVTDFRVVAPDRPVTESIAEPITVVGDRPQLRQVLDNLLANARIHTPSGTPVHVSLTGDGSDVRLAVTDQGAGIPVADQPRIFERFWRADPARSRSRGGSGLGLTIVATIVAAHRGTITVESQPGQGTTFVVRLPSAGNPA